MLAVETFFVFLMVNSPNLLPTQQLFLERPTLKIQLAKGMLSSSSRYTFPSVARQRFDGVKWGAVDSVILTHEETDRTNRFYARPADGNWLVVQQSLRIPLR